MKKILRTFFLVPVYIYQKIISPFLPSSCIYSPSCSEYTKQSVLKFGVIKGFIAGGMRIGRCIGGFYTGGEDPVAEEFSLRELKGKYTEFRIRKKKKRN